MICVGRMKRRNEIWSTECQTSFRLLHANWPKLRKRKSAKLRRNDGLCNSGICCTVLCQSLSGCLDIVCYSIPDSQCVFRLATILFCGPLRWPYSRGFFNSNRHCPCWHLWGGTSLCEETFTLIQWFGRAFTRSSSPHSSTCFSAIPDIIPLAVLPFYRLWLARPLRKLIWCWPMTWQCEGAIKHQFFN